MCLGTANSSFALAALPACVAWAALGAGLGRLLRTPAALRRFNRAMGALLAFSPLPVLAGWRPPPPAA